MDNVELKLNEVNFVKHIESIPCYSKELKDSVIDIIKDDIDFQNEHPSLWWMSEESKKEYFDSWLNFIDALVHRDECIMGVIEHPDDSTEKRKAAVVINLKITNIALAIDIVDAFWTANGGYIGTFEYKGECVRWIIDGTEFYIELGDQ